MVGLDHSFEFYYFILCSIVAVLFNCVVLVSKPSWKPGVIHLSGYMLLGNFLLVLMLV